MNVALTFNAKPEDGNSSSSCDTADARCHLKVTDEEILSPAGLMRGETSEDQYGSVLTEQASIYDASFDDAFAEWDTYQTILAVRDALAEEHNVTLIEANEDAFEKLRTLRPDIVFNIAEGMYGISREAQIPAMLDMLNIPYTGSDPLTLSTCLDKSRTKEILLYNRIPTARFITVSSEDELQPLFSSHGLKFPVFVKPVAEGSSKGIFNSSVAADPDTLKKIVMKNLAAYRQPCIIEEYLPGREFTVALLGNAPQLSVLPVVEISFEALPGGLLPIYSFEAKWIADSRENPLDIFSCPAAIDAELEEKIKQTAAAAYNTLRCRDWARIDLRLDAKGIPNVIEINPLPGILPDPRDNSCYPKAARTAGMDYNTMINAVLNSALKRYKMI